MFVNYIAKLQNIHFLNGETTVELQELGNHLETSHHILLLASPALPNSNAFWRF